MTARDAARSRFPAGLMGTIALVVLVESQLAALRDDITAMDVRSWRRAGQAVSSPEVVSSEVLVLGDSSMKLGVAPQVFAERSGHSAYNLALPGANVPVQLFLLRRALAAGARPKAVVVAFTPRILMDDYWHMARFYAELVSLRELFKLSADARDMTFLGTQLVARVVPTVKRRLELRATLLVRLWGEWSTLRYLAGIYRRNWDANRGAQMMPPVDEGTRAQIAKARDLIRENVMPAPWRCERMNRTYLDRLFELAHSHGVPVFWVLTPYQPQPEGPAPRPALEAQRERSIRVRMSQFPNLFVVDARSPGLAPDRFLDFVHLDSRGAAQFSAGLGEVVAASLAQPPASRWITMGPRPVPMLAAAPEDLDASRAFLKARREAWSRRY